MIFDFHAMQFYFISYSSKIFTWSLNQYCFVEIDLFRNKKIDRDKKLLSGADNKLSFLITTKRNDDDKHITTFMNTFQSKEEFEDTKVVIRIRISKKNKQHNGQKKKYKRTNNELQNIHIKLKIE